MIWTVMLGFVLTSVFFFFGMRQRLMVGAQRETAQLLNANSYLESLANYLEAHPEEMDGALDGIDVSLTRNVTEILGQVDNAQEKEYSATGSRAIFVEWNACTTSTTSESDGDLIIGDVIYKADGDPTKCSGYKDLVGPINIPSPYSIFTLNEPFRYRIKPSGGTQLIDTLWHLKLSQEFEYGKILTIERTF